MDALRVPSRIAMTLSGDQIGGASPAPSINPVAGPAVDRQQIESGRHLISLAVHEVSWSGEDLVERAAAASRAGWSMLGLYRRSLWQFGEERTRELLGSFGLEVSSLSWAGGFTGTAGFTFREAIEDGRAALAEAAELGAGTVIVASGARGGHTFRHAQRVIADGLRHLGEIALRRGVRLAVLTSPSRREHARMTSVDTLEMAQQLLDCVNLPSVGLAVPIDRWQGRSAALEILKGMASRIFIATSGPLSLGSLAIASGGEAARIPLQDLIGAGFRGVWELDHSLVDGTGHVASRGPGILREAACYSDLMTSLSEMGGSLHAGR